MMATDAPMYHRQPMAGVVAGLTTKSDKIRALFRAGYSRSEIRKYLRIKYQHVRKVLVDSGFRETRLNPVSGHALSGRDSAKSPAQARVIVGPGGRVVIPAPYRSALGIAEGDAVFMRLDGEELRIVSDEMEVQRVREMIARYVPEDASLVDELIRERRREVEADGGR